MASDISVIVLAGGGRRTLFLVRPFMLPRFEPLSVELSCSSKLDTRLKLRIACLQLDQQERREERELKLQRELELKRLEVEAETAIKMHQLELQTAMVSSHGSDR